MNDVANSDDVDTVEFENAVITDKVYTIVIWSNFQDLPKLYVLEGDYRHLNGVTIAIGDDADEQRELVNLMYSDEGHELHTEYANLQDCLQFIGDKPFGCINCGMYP